MSKKWFKLARKENFQWNRLVAKFHPSSSLLHRSPLHSIHPNRFSANRKKGPLLLAGRSKEKGREIKRRRSSLAQLLCSVVFHCKFNKHSLFSPFCLTTAMALVPQHLCPLKITSAAGAWWLRFKVTITCKWATMSCSVRGREASPQVFLSTM